MFLVCLSVDIIALLEFTAQTQAISHAKEYRVLFLEIFHISFPLLIIFLILLDSRGPVTKGPFLDIPDG